MPFLNFDPESFLLREVEVEEGLNKPVLISSIVWRSLPWTVWGCCGPWAVIKRPLSSPCSGKEAECLQDMLDVCLSVFFFWQPSWLAHRCTETGVLLPSGVLYDRIRSQTAEWVAFWAFKVFLHLVLEQQFLFGGSLLLLLFFCCYLLRLSLLWRNNISL